MIRENPDKIAHVSPGRLWQNSAGERMDRLTHHAHIIELVGESYRFRQRMQQEVEEGQPVDSVDNITQPLHAIKRLLINLS